MHEFWTLTVSDNHTCKPTCGKAVNTEHGAEPAINLSVGLYSLTTWPRSSGMRTSPCQICRVHSVVHGCFHEVLHCSWRQYNHTHCARKSWRSCRVRRVVSRHAASQQSGMSLCSRRAHLLSVTDVRLLSNLTPPPTHLWHDVAAENKEQNRARIQPTTVAVYILSVSRIDFSVCHLHAHVTAHSITLGLVSFKMHVFYGIADYELTCVNSKTLDQAEARFKRILYVSRVRLAVSFFLTGMFFCIFLCHK